MFALRLDVEWLGTLVEQAERELEECRASVDETRSRAHVVRVQRHEADSFLPTDISNR